MAFGSTLKAACLSLVLISTAQAKPAAKPAKKSAAKPAKKPAAKPAAKSAVLPVTIETTPPGAKVYVDDKAKGMACQSGPECKPRMSHGIHKILIELDGYKSLEENIDVGTTRRFAFTLQAAPGRLEVKTLLASEAAKGAEIYVDGQLAGTVPATLEVPAGKHTLEVRRSGYLPFSEELELKAGEPRPIIVRIRAEPKTATKAAATPKATAAKAAPEPGAEKGADNGVDKANQKANEKGVQVTIVPRNPRYAYVVTSNRGPSCPTPCMQQLAPGPLAINVSGPGTKLFRRQITVLDSPTQITVQHYTKSRAIAGSILTLLGLPMAALGGIFLANGLGSTTIKLGNLNMTTNIAVGSALAAHGLVFTVVGLAQLGTIKYNTVRVTSTGVTAARETLPLRFLAGGIAPTEDRTGAMAGATFAF